MKTLWYSEQNPAQCKSLSLSLCRSSRWFFGKVALFFCAKLPYIGISCKYGTRTIYSDSIFCLALIAEDLWHGPVITKKDSRFSCCFFDGAGEFVEGTAALNQETIKQFWTLLLWLYKNYFGRSVASKLYQLLILILRLQSCVKSVLLYGCETWLITSEIRRKIQTFVNRCLRYILRIRWPKIISNKDLWGQQAKKI